MLLNSICCCFRDIRF